MEEEARKLLEEGIRKKLVSPGKGELSTFPNGTKVRKERSDELSPDLRNEFKRCDETR